MQTNAVFPFFSHFVNGTMCNGGKTIAWWRCNNGVLNVFASRRENIWKRLECNGKSVEKKSQFSGLYWLLQIEWVDWNALTFARNPLSHTRTRTFNSKGSQTFKHRWNQTIVSTKRELKTVLKKWNATWWFVCCGFWKLWKNTCFVTWKQIYLVAKFQLPLFTSPHPRYSKV